MNTKEKLFIISGPSGAGEDSVIEGLRKYFDIERVITTTTREKRKGETQRNPYYFVTKKEFKSRIKKGEFIEYAEAYNGNYYGTTSKEIERVIKSNKIGIWKIEYKGVQIVKKKLPNIKSIYIAPPDLKTLENRIKKRSKVDKSYLAERMKYTKQWLKYEKIYDYKVINQEGKLDQTITKVRDIIKSNAKGTAGKKRLIGLFAVIVAIGLIIGIGYMQSNGRNQIGNYIRRVTQSYGIKAKEKSYSELLQYIPKDTILAYVAGPMTFDFFSENQNFASDLEIPTYQKALFFYPKNGLSAGIVLRLDNPDTGWIDFKDLVAQIWANKFPEKVPITLPDGTIVYELVPKPDEIEPISVEYKGNTIFELSDGEEYGIYYANIGENIIVSSSSQVVRLALLAVSDVNQRLQKGQYLRCSGNIPYQFIIADRSINLDNTSLFPDILLNNNLPAEYCI